MLPFIETVLELEIRVVMCYVITAVLASYTGLLWAWYFGSGSGFFDVPGAERTDSAQTKVYGKQVTE